MIVPALAAAYLLAGPPALGTRIRQLAVAGVAMVATSAAWPVAVTLWPGAKPYIGGSTDGSVWDLILGYNGFGRLTGGEGGGQGARLRRRGRPVAHVQRAGRRPGRLAAAARRGEPARRPVADAARAAHGPPPRRVGAVRRLGARARRRLLEPAGHLPPVLRERARARGRGAVRRGRRDPVALGADVVGRARRPRPGARRHRLDGGRAAGPHAGLRPVAAHGDRGPRRARAVRLARPAHARPVRPAHGRGRRRGGRARADRRAGGLQRRQPRPCAQRQQRDGRALLGRVRWHAGRRRAAWAA